MALVVFPGATNAAETEVRATLRICGESACTTVHSTAARFRPLLSDPKPSPLPPPATAFYVLELSVEGAPRAQKGWYVPSSHRTRWLLSAPSGWMKVGRRGVAFLERHLPAGSANHAPRPERVTVAQRLVRDTSAYAHVFDRLPRAPVPAPGAHWIPLSVVWPSGTPWRFEHAPLSALPAQRVLARPGGWFRIPIALAKAIARDARP